MKKLTANQIQTLKNLTNATGFHLTIDGKKFVSSVGCSGSAIRSLMNAGLIEKYNHKIYNCYYTVTTEGAKALKGV